MLDEMAPGDERYRMVGHRPGLEQIVIERQPPATLLHPAVFLAPFIKDVQPPVQKDQPAAHVQPADAAPGNLLPQPAPAPARGAQREIRAHPPEGPSQLHLSFIPFIGCHVFSLRFYYTVT